MSVDASWARIQQWLRERAPSSFAKLAPAASPEAQMAAESAFPSPWPSDLRKWYSLQNGETMQVLWKCLLPQWAVLSLEDMTAEVAMYADSADLWNDVESAETAGEPAFAFLPEFVPIASNGCAETLFVDLRPGPLSGCVTGYFKGDADTYGPVWPSVAAMLDDLADSLEEGRACDGWFGTVEDGELSWDLPDV